MSSDTPSVSTCGLIYGLEEKAACMQTVRTDRQRDVVGLAKLLRPLAPEAYCHTCAFANFCSSRQDGSGIFEFSSQAGLVVLLPRYSWLLLQSPIHVFTAKALISGSVSVRQRANRRRLRSGAAV